MTQTKPTPQQNAQLAEPSEGQATESRTDILVPRPATGKRITRTGGDDASNGYWIHDHLGPRHYVGPGIASGPVRSTEDIITEIEECLASDLLLDASGVHLSVEGSVLTLAGGVETEEDRRKIGTWAASVTRGALQVANRLRIRGADRSTDGDDNEQ